MKDREKGWDRYGSASEIGAKSRGGEAMGSCWFVEEVTM
jgi:hypothetical protein